MAGILFDGSDDFIHYGDIDALDSAAALSLLFWLYQVTWTSTEGIMAKTGVNPSGTGWRVIQYQNSPEICLQQLNNPTFSEGHGGSFTLNTWQHAAFVFDGSLSGDSNKLKLYQNGVAQSLTFGTGGFGSTLPSGTTDVFALGYENFSVSFGNIALVNLKVYSAALTQTEIRNEMSRFLPYRTENLVIWDPMLDAGAIKEWGPSKITRTIGGAPTKVTNNGPALSYGGSVRRIQ